jgi:hypothetical protein
LAAADLAALGFAALKPRCNAYGGHQQAPPSALSPPLISKAWRTARRT